MKTKKLLNACVTEQGFMCHGCGKPIGLIHRGRTPYDPHLRRVKGVAVACCVACFEQVGEIHPDQSSQPKGRKQKVFERDGGACVYCRRTIDLDAEPCTDLQLTFDHLIPKTRGGTSGMHNLVTACFTCNQRKSSKLPLNFIWGLGVPATIPEGTATPRRSPDAGTSPSTSSDGP